MLWKLVLAFLTSLWMFSDVVLAQRDEPPRIPQPISIDDLARYSEILVLSAEQRLSMEAAYDEYVDDIAPLRREMIEAAVANAQVLYRGDEFNGIVPGFVARLHAVDSTFFDAIDPMLIDAQRGRFQRVRELRERRMLASVHVLWVFISEGVPDVRERLDALSPPPEAIAPLEPALADYERRLTIGLRACFAAATKLCSEAQPDDLSRAELIEGVKSLRSLNRRTLETLAPLLPEEVADAWRNDVRMRAYPNMPRDIQSGAVSRLKVALSSELDAAERERVEELLAEAQRQSEEIMIAAMDLYDANAIRPAGPSGAFDDVGHFTRMSAIGEDARKRARAIHESLLGLLGKERMDSLPPSRHRPDWAGTGLRAACGVTVLFSTIMVLEEGEGVPMSRSDPLVPVPLDVRAVANMAGAFAIDEQQRMAIESIVARDAATLNKAMSPLNETLMRTSMNASIPKSGEGDPLAQAQAAEEVRARMREQVIAAEARTLEAVRESIGVASDDSRWQAVVRWSARRTSALDIELTNSRERNRAEQLDLIPLLLGSGLPDVQWSALEPLVLDYEGELTAARTTLFDAFRAYWTHHLAQRMGWRGKPYDPHVSEEEPLHVLYQDLASLNQRWAAKFAAELDGDIALRVQKAFEQAAYPPAYRDRASPTAAIERALALRTLHAEQRTRVSEIDAAYRSSSDSIRRAMIAVCAAYAPDLPYIGYRWTDERARRVERAKLELELLSDARAQASRRAVRGLRQSLSSEQFVDVFAGEDK